MRDLFRSSGLRLNFFPVVGAPSLCIRLNTTYYDVTGLLLLSLLELIIEPDAADIDDDI